MTQALTPKAIVAALDEHIIGQKDAKRAVAVALRHRWRRQRLDAELRDEVTPKNILMIGPTGCGKTEISRRLAKLADAPFIKIEATKFTEVGYVGRDVEQIARDLVEEAVRLERERRREAVREDASKAAMERLLDTLTGKGASEATRESFRQRITDNHMNDTEIEIELQDSPAAPMELTGMGGQMGMIDLSDMMGKAFGQKKLEKRKLRVADAWDKLVEEEEALALPPLFQLSRLLMLFGSQSVVLWLYLRFGTESYRNVTPLPFMLAACVLVSVGLGLNARYDPISPRPPAQAWSRAAIVGVLSLGAVLAFFFT